MRFEKRIQTLEARMFGDPLILQLPDASTRELRGHGDFLLRLFYRACSGMDLGPGAAAQLDLIRESVAAEEQGAATWSNFWGRC
jgi:hypothetical protein